MSHLKVMINADKFKEDILNLITKFENDNDCTIHTVEKRYDNDKNKYFIEFIYKTADAWFSPMKWLGCFTTKFRKEK